MDHNGRYSDRHRRWFQSSNERNDDRLNRTQHWILFVAAVFTAYQSWHAFLLSEEKKWQQADVQFRSDWLQQKQAKERLQYERELRAKAEEIAALNREIASQVTGGDSFVYLAFTAGDSNETILSLLHRGKYPVFDVTIEIVDSDEVDERLTALGLKDYSGRITREQMIELAKPKDVLRYPMVRPNLALRVRDLWQLPVKKDSARYGVSIFTRNGIFYQTLLLRRVNGSWKQASQVFKTDTSKKAGRRLLYEWADPDFPRNKGKIVW